MLRRSRSQPKLTTSRRSSPPMPKKRRRNASGPRTAPSSARGRCAANRVLASQAQEVAVEGDGLGMMIELRPIELAGLKGLKRFRRAQGELHLDRSEARKLAQEFAPALANKLGE